MVNLKTGKNSKGFYIVFGILVVIFSFLVVKLNELALVDKAFNFKEIDIFLNIFFAIYLIVIIYKINKKSFKYINFNLFFSILGFVYLVSHIYFYRAYKINGGSVELLIVANMSWFFLVIIYFIMVKTGYRGLRGSKKEENL